MTKITHLVANFWCWNPAENHDKVYQLDMSQDATGKWDVVSLYGRRGKKLTIHVIGTGWMAWRAIEAYQNKEIELEQKGYTRIQEDVAQLGNKFPR